MAQLRGAATVPIGTFFLNPQPFAPLKLCSVAAPVLHVILRGAASGGVPTGERVVVGIIMRVAAVLSIDILAVRPDPSPTI